MGISWSACELFCKVYIFAPTSTKGKCILPRTIFNSQNTTDIQRIFFKEKRRTTKVKNGSNVYGSLK